MAFKLPNIKDVMSRKHGTGEYARGGKKFEQRMKPGESKFQYDVRMRKEGGRKTTSAKPGSTYQAPDPSTEITGLTGGPSYDWKEQEFVEGFFQEKPNPGDLRMSARWMTHKLPSAPGDEWTYEFEYEPRYDYESAEEWRVGEGKDFIPKGVEKTLARTTKGVSIWATDKHGEKHRIKPGSESDKAIRKRYTGSETGDLDAWKGHDTRGKASEWSYDPTTYETIEETYSSTDIERKSYLPYDLAKKHYNPKYKGSKK